MATIPPRRTPDHATVGAPASSPDDSRAARKRTAILEAARTVFLGKGYAGTSMDEIAALAAVSKQTVYKHFADKETLFNTIVTGAVDQASGTFQPALVALRDTENLGRDLRDWARLLLITTMDPRILQLRRLVIAEATRFPAMGGAYYEQTYERTTALLAATLEHLTERGLLRVDDAPLAAQQLIWLTFIPRNKVMLCGDDIRFTKAELHRIADAGVRVFLAAYGQS